MPGFFASYGSETHCSAALFALRWPDGFLGPCCGSQKHCRVAQGSRQLFQCHACRHQTSLTAGTVMDSTEMPLRIWHPAWSRIKEKLPALGEDEV